MKLKISSLYSVALYAALAGQALILLGLPLGITAFASVGTMLIAVTNLVALIAMIFDKNKNIRAGNDIVFLVTFVILTFGIWMFSLKFNYESLVKILTFIQLPVYLMMAQKVNSKYAVKAIYMVNMCYPLMFALFHASTFAYRFVGIYGEIIHDNLTLGYGNPNETGMYLMVCFFVLLSGVSRYKGTWKGLLCAVEAIYLAYLIYLTYSRAALFLSGTVLALVIFVKSVKLKESVLRVIFTVPILFAAILLLFPWISELDFMGELFDTGRAVLYGNFMSSLSAFSVLFGSFGEYELSNLHNAYISIFASLGILVIPFFLTVMYRSYKKVCGVRLSRKESTALLFGSLAIIVHSSVESAFLVSGSAFGASAFLLFYLLSQCPEMKSEESQT